MLCDFDSLTYREKSEGQCGKTVPPGGPFDSHTVLWDCTPQVSVSILGTVFYLAL